MKITKKMMIKFRAFSLPVPITVSPVLVTVSPVSVTDWGVMIPLAEHPRFTTKEAVPSCSIDGTASQGFGRCVATCSSRVQVGGHDALLSGGAAPVRARCRRG